MQENDQKQTIPRNLLLTFYGHLQIQRLDKGQERKRICSTPCSHLKKFYMLGCIFTFYDKAKTIKTGT